MRKDVKEALDNVVEMLLDNFNDDLPEYVNSQVINIMSYIEPDEIYAYVAKNFKKQL